MSPQGASARRNRSQTKIVATLGPASDGAETIAELIRAGVDVFRINMAHGTRGEHQETLNRVRQMERQAGRPVAVLIDLCGPKIRLGELPEGQMDCGEGEQIRFVRGDQPQQPGDLVTTYEPLVDELDVGDRVMLADGTVGLVVEQRDDDSALCRVVQSGRIRSRQGVNLPGVKLSAPALGDVDRDNAAWAAAEGVDFVGLSFVRTPDEVRQLKTLLHEKGSEAHVIAKIEKPEALACLPDIVDAADGLMVARGDLGVEIDIADIAVTQKHIIDLCRQRRKPVIVATQMLDSMTHSRLPTRAEVTDVANAILDGADACMLSGETAIGEYPREAVDMMHRVAIATEPSFRQRPPAPQPDLTIEGIDQIKEQIVFSGGRTAEQLDAQTLVVGSCSGATALALSKYRNTVPIVGVSNSDTTLRRMCLYWGVVPLAGAPMETPREVLEYVVDHGEQAGALEPGDRVVLIAGTGLLNSSQNVIVVYEIP
jgi:pyruvate kinase